MLESVPAYQWTCNHPVIPPCTFRIYNIKQIGNWALFIFACYVKYLKNCFWKLYRSYQCSLSAFFLSFLPQGLWGKRHHRPFFGHIFGSSTVTILINLTMNGWCALIFLSAALEYGSFSHWLCCLFLWNTIIF